MWRRWETWERVLSAGIGLAGVALAVVSLFRSSNWTQTALAAGLSVVAIVAVISALAVSLTATHREQSGAREARWAQAVRNLSDAAQHLADISAQSPDIDTAASQSRAREACSQIEKAFTSVAGSECRVTIKELYASNGDIAVRSLIVPSRRNVGAATVDLVSENTDFEKIMSGEDHYLENDLPAALTAGYRNSHWTPDLLTRWQQSGQYPYRSTLVLPIRTRTEGGSSAAENWSIVGFFCIDSSKSGAFSIEEDRHAAELVAAMFVSVWSDITEEEE